MSTPIEDVIILQVEDDDASAVLFRYAVREAGIAACVFRVTTGESATAFLLKQSPYEATPTPHAVLLDLNLPGKDGFEVLADARMRPELHGVRIVVFSNSDWEADKAKAYKLGANAYLTKGGGLDSFCKAVHAVCDRPSDQHRA